MGKLVKISPYKKDFQGSPMKTFERSLADNGYVRSPGTKKLLLPHKEADGRYRTGIDKNANYIKALPKEEQDAEIALIDDILKQLKEVYPDTDFGNRSKVWNVFSDDMDKEGNIMIKTTHISLANEDVILNTDRIEDLLKYSWVRVHPEIAKSAEHIRTRKSPDCTYYIADDDAENRIMYAKKKIVNKAIHDFEELAPSVKKQVARLIGLPVTDDSKEEAIYNLIDNFLKSDSALKEGNHTGRTPITVFNEIMALSDDRRHVKDLVEEGIRYNFYRRKGDIIMQGTETIAASTEDLVNHLLDSKNQKELRALEVHLKAKNK